MASDRLLATAKPLGEHPNNQKPNMDLGAGLVDPWFALGAVRIRRTGATPRVDIDVTVLSGNSAIFFNAYILGARGTPTDNVKIPTPTASGTYTFIMHLDDTFTGAVTYGYEIKLSTQGVAFTGCTSGNPTSVTATQINGTLFGFGSNPRRLICTLSKQ
jgi:hypothetical protein